MVANPLECCHSITAAIWQQTAARPGNGFGLRLFSRARKARHISVAVFISQSCKKMHQKSNKDLREPWQSWGLTLGNWD